MHKEDIEKIAIGSVVVIVGVIAFLVTFVQYLKLTMMTLSIIILILALKRKELFNELMHINVPFSSFRGIALTSGVAAFIYWSETRIWSLQSIILDYPKIGLPSQIYLWLSFSHLISYAVHGLLFIYLWFRWKRFLPALLTVLFEISLSEFAFVGPQWYQFGYIFLWTWTWYIGFLIVGLPFIVLRENFDLSDKRLWFIYMLGVSVLFINALLSLRDPWTWDYEIHAFRLFPELIYEPTAWYNMYINRVGKILMASAFTFVKLKNGKEVHSNE